MATSRRTRGRAQARHRVEPLFAGYQPLDGAFDEIFTPAGKARRGLADVVRRLDGLGAKELKLRQRLADGAFLRAGITFRVYSDSRGIDKIFPFDLIPRAVSAKRWEALERGLEQRVRALNLFLADVYGPQKIFADGVVPKEIVLGSKGYLPELQGLRPPGGVYVHVAGIDLVRAPNGEFLVLEDNVRVPSGVSYVLENRLVMKRVFPQLFAQAHVRPVDGYPIRLREASAASRTRTRASWC
ncbi:MAG: circularly permuted type 2 ATP-grasp protein [Sandaracinaceae bacterium]